MKNQVIKIAKPTITILLILITLLGNAQTKEVLGIINIDTKNMMMNNDAMTSMVHLELERINKYEVLDKYDVAYLVEEKGINIDKSFGKSNQVEVGKLLKADKMVTGSVERFGDKIVIIFRLIDVASERIETTSVMEFVNLQEEIQLMSKLALNKLFGIENNQNLVDILTKVETVITNPKTTLNLSGPRMGVTMLTGQNAKRVMAPKSQGGYNQFPISSMFGYQFEKQYLSSGDFQALAEGIVAINGLESGQISPAFTFLNGLRFNKSGFEFGIGPTFRLVRLANGFYDTNGEWQLAWEKPKGSDYVIKERIDNRGNVHLNTSLLIAVGKTLRSGHLNVPINLFIIPNKQGTAVGLSFGFNVAKP